MKAASNGFENIPSPEEIRAAKRRQILEKAAAAFSRNGYRGVSISEIAAEVGLTKTGIYHYVKSKEELLFYCHEMALDMAFSTLEPLKGRTLTGLVAIHEVLCRYISIFSCMPFRFMMLDDKKDLSRERMGIIGLRRDEFESELRKLIRAGMDDGSFRKDVDPKLAGMIIFGAANWVPHWFREDGEWSIEFVSHSVARDILRTIVKNPEDVEGLCPLEIYDRGLPDAAFQRGDLTDG